MKSFEEIYKINVNDKTEKKNGLTYLSWAWAWAEFKKCYPDASYSIKRFENNLPYVSDKTGYMVFTEVTANGITHEMWLPVMDNRNKAILEATMTDINKSIMRCLTKNLAMFGLGLYIYAGEDLPEEESAEVEQAPKKVPFENVPKTKPQLTLEQAFEIEVNTKEGYKKLKDLSREQLELIIKHSAVKEWVEGARIILINEDAKK